MAQTSNPKEHTLQYKLKDSLKEKQLKAQTEQSQQFVGEGDILR